jgi:hypothetical protein
MADIELSDDEDEDEKIDYKKLEKNYLNDKALLAQLLQKKN